MTPAINVYQNFGISYLSDTTMKQRKAICLIVAMALLFWIFRSSPESLEDEEVYEEGTIQAKLQQTQKELRISRKQLLAYEQMLKTTCLEKVNHYYGDDKVPTIYVITPTYKRPEQKAELTRLSHTFMLVPKLHWIVVEDAVNNTQLVANLLKESNINHTILHARTPQQYKPKKREYNWAKPRGVEQRNAALEWLRLFKSGDNDKGIVYFADDDNSYSLKIFQEMRHIKRVGVWPVGLVGGLKVEKPIVNSAGIVTGFNAMWAPERPFAIDMAGFAINLDLIKKNENVVFSFDVNRGYQETAILSSVITSVHDLEPLADKCTKVYVWHTKTKEPKLTNDEKLVKNKKPTSDFGIEV